MYVYYCFLKDVFGERRNTIEMSLLCDFFVYGVFILLSNIINVLTLYVGKGKDRIILFAVASRGVFGYNFFNNVKRKN